MSEIDQLRAERDELRRVAEMANRVRGNAMEELERVKKEAAAMREALEELNNMLAMRGPGDNPYAVVRRALEHARTLNL